MSKSTKPTARNHPDFDSLILSLGDAMAYMVNEMDRIQEATHPSSTREQQKKCEPDTSNIYDCLVDITHAISALPATGMKAAAVQMRVAQNEMALDSEESEVRHNRLNHSILSVIEANGGGIRDDWAGRFFIDKNPHPIGRKIDNG